MLKTTDDLIAGLSADLSKVAPGAVARRVALGLGLGGLGSAILMLAWLGPRPDLAQAVMTPMFWMKFGYAALTGLILAGVLVRLAKPAARIGALAMAAGAPFALVAMIYSVACNETSAPFLAIWYTLGMVLVAALGAAAGSRLLRWR
jgi:hypothetical protein